MAEKILIAGAGIGGLTAGLALAGAGYDVKLYEQSEALREVGAGLQLSANAMRVLHAVGVGDAVRRLGSELDGKAIRLWDSGQEWKLFDLGAESVERYGYPYVTVHRADLHRVLTAALVARCPGALELGRCAYGFEPRDGGVELVLEDEEHVAGDLLVACDGVHSAIRQQLHGSGQAEYTGMMAWRGLVPTAGLPASLQRPIGVNWVGPGAHVIHYPVRGGELTNFVGIVEKEQWKEESWSARGTREECLADFAGWHPDVLALIEHVEIPYEWALLARAPLSAWGEGRVTLLGDAAHPMLPFLATGAGMAIEDGLVLARCLLAEPGDPVAGLRRYERARGERTARAVRGSAENAKRFHDRVLSSAEEAQAYVDREWSEARIRERYEWIFAYDAEKAPI